MGERRAGAEAWNGKLDGLPGGQAGEQRAAGDHRLGQERRPFNSATTVANASA